MTLGNHGTTPGIYHARPATRHGGYGGQRPGSVVIACHCYMWGNGACSHVGAMVPAAKCSFSDIYHTMGVLPSAQPVATLGSSFILSSFDVARTIPYVLADCYVTVAAW